MIFYRKKWNTHNIRWEKNYLEKNSSPEASFVIVTIEDNEMIGTVSLESIEHINRCATLGIFIGNKDFRSKGYGTEAMEGEESAIL